MESIRLIPVFLGEVRYNDLIFRMVTVTKFFQHPVIEFPVEKLRISHGFIGQKNTYRKKHDGCHPHARKWLHHIFLYKFSSEIIQEKKDDKKYDSKDEGQADSTFADNRSE